MLLLFLAVGPACRRSMFMLVWVCMHVNKKYTHKEQHQQYKNMNKYINKFIHKCVYM